MSESANNEYDAVIVGGGPGGLTAGIYVARARLSGLLIEKGLFGGQMVTSDRYENYPGFPDGISGSELGEYMRQQAIKFGLKTINAEATGLRLEGDKKVVETTDGDFIAGTVIIAGGATRRKLGVPGEEEFAGRGVSYCAVCDADFFHDVAVAVVGGGNSAITEALHLAKFASKVTLIHRRDELRAARVMQEKAFAEPKIDFCWNSVVEKIEGEDIVSRLKLRNVKTEERYDLEVEGIFISTGIKPNTDFVKGVIPLDDAGYIITNIDMETEVSGVFAAGDIRHGSVRQAITAAGDGATAGFNAERHLSHYV
jgi:thioredoxin reductase (NADPH)